MAAQDQATKIEEIAHAALAGANNEGDRQVFSRIARDAKAIRLGLAGRLLTPVQFGQLSDLVYPQTETVEYASDTLAAAARVDVAESAFADAERVFGHAYSEAEVAHLGGRFAEDPKEPGTYRLLEKIDIDPREADARLSAAREVLNARAEELLAARVLHSKLSGRDEHEHRRKRAEADAAAALAERESRLKQRTKQARRSLVGRVKDAL